MGHAALLLDKAKKHVSPANYSGLAAVLGVSRQSVHRWKTGAEPIPEDRIAQIARIAQEDAAQWLVVLHAEWATGPAAPGWKEAAKRVSVAAALSVLALLPLAYSLPAQAEPLTAVCIMRKAMLAAAVILAAVWSRRGRPATAVLA